MSRDNWARVKEIFQGAIDLSPAEREAFLDQVCAGDANLRAEAETLLAEHEGRGNLLSPTLSPGSNPIEGPGAIIGRYKLLQLVGEGGFGSVYMAEQEEPVRRKVALKIIKLGMDTRQVIARFEAERQALALMDHPNIARVLDAGATETGRPYFVMELVRGIPITEYCDREHLSTRERLLLFQSVCSSVQHAHQKGIIHRDIKPTNVLVTLHDGVPVPKVIDFGIAKATNQRLTEKTLFTEFHQFVGTPEYMSPEQAEMSGLDVDTRTDIYALGVLLYELLTGATPFDRERLRGVAYSEIHRVIREAEPEKPSTRVSTLGDAATTAAKHRKTDAGTLRRLLAGDLDWIVMKAIEKDRTVRYDTANSLRLDIERHLRNEPVVAGPPSTPYRVRKFVRRNRTAVLVFGTVSFALLFGAGLATFGFVQASRERALARQEAEAATTINRFYTGMLESLNPDASSVLQSPTLGGSREPRIRRDVSVTEMLRDATGRIDESFATKPLLGAQARETIAESLLGLGADDDALEQFRKVEETRRAVLGERDREVLRSRLLTVGALAELDRQQAAAELAGETVADLERYLGEDDPLTLVGEEMYASTLMGSGDFASVDSILGITLERQRRVLGDDHRDTIETMTVLVVRHCWGGRGEQAVELSSEAARRAKKVFGPDDPLALNAAAWHAFSLTFLRRNAEAKSIVRSTMEGAKRVLGEESHEVGMLSFALARALNSDYEADEREAMYREWCEASSPAEIGQNWIEIHDYTRLLVRMGKVDEAVEIARALRDAWETVDGTDIHLTDDRVDTIRRLVRRRYQRLLAVAGRWEDVRVEERKALAEYREEADRDDAGAEEWNRYAWRLLSCETADLRDPGKALELATRAVADRGAEDPGSLPDILDTQARAFAMTGELEAAFRTQSRAMDIRLRSDAEDADDGVAPLLPDAVRYAILLQRDGAATAAVDAATEGVGRSHEPGTAEHVASLRGIGEGLANRGLHRWAVPVLRRCVEEARQIGGDRELLETLAALAHSTARSGRPGEAELLVDEALSLFRRRYVSEPIEWTPGLGLTAEGERSREATHTKLALAHQLVDLGRLSEAEEFLRQIECVQGLYSYATLKGEVLLAKGDAEGALPYLRCAYLNGLANPGGGLVRSEGEYGRCLALAGHLDEGATVLLRAYDRAADWCGPGSAMTSRLAGWIGEL